MLKLCALAALSALACSYAVAQQPAGQPAEPASGAGSPEILKILETQKQVFGQFHLVPIVVPRGEQVGDIVDVDTATLIAGPDDCFPGLKPRLERIHVECV